MMAASVGSALYGFTIARHQLMVRLQTETSLFPLMPAVQMVKADPCSYCGRATHKRDHLTCEGCGAPR